ncbi:hypothetical protein O181_010034 [Austropuccinia psidii MF-1]|uniref:Uncharacterized protein n=1 Tax=Austropuccinia psidii MF-1 TaxID=1389203 RepID=A0A9Q3GKF8_9BASI|nr:hypothetical protein [Austropuccinia psidii MF-1]
MDQFEAFCQRAEAHIQEENARSHPQIWKTSVPSEHNKGRVHFDERFKPGPSSPSSLKGKSSIMEPPVIQIFTGGHSPDVIIPMEFEIPQISTPTNLRQIPVQIVHAEVPGRNMISVPKRLHQIFEANEGGITSSLEEELSSSEDGYSSAINLKSVSNPIYQMKSSKGKEPATEPEDPEHHVSNYQDGIFAASSVASTSRGKIPEKNNNLGPKTIADYSRHKGGTDLSKNHKGKLKSTSQE